VLSRCQRFDLKRIEPEVMMAHLARIAGLEGASLAPDAMALITRAAEGSVRDAMSLMDQAIAHGAGETSAAQVRAMLGLADRGRVLDLYDMILKGAAAEALTELSGQYADGADPMAVLRDLAEITHWISVIKITPDAAEDPTVPPEERARGQAMAAAIPMRVLTRMWQMLLKALEEVAQAPNAMMAAEMAVIRLTHVADLPDPETLLKRIQQGPGAAVAAGQGGPGASSAAPSGAGSAQSAVGASAVSGHGAPRGPSGSGGAATALAYQPETALARFAQFDDVVELIRRMRDVKLLLDVEGHLRLVRYSPGRIEFEPTPDAPRDLAANLAARLQGWTGVRWGVSVTGSGGGETILETRNAERHSAEAEAMKNPLVQAIFAAFPEARIDDIRTPEALNRQASFDALPEVEDEWDPFENN